MKLLLNWMQNIMDKNSLTYSIIYGTINLGGEALSKWEKLLEKIRNNPKTVTFEEVDKVMRRLGYDGKFPRTGSSHCTYRKKGHTPITVPRHEPYVKEEYVKLIIEVMDED